MTGQPILFTLVCVCVLAFARSRSKSQPNCRRPIVSDAKRQTAGAPHIRCSAVYLRQKLEREKSPRGRRFFRAAIDSRRKWLEICIAPVVTRRSTMAKRKAVGRKMAHMCHWFIDMSATIESWVVDIFLCFDTTADIIKIPRIMDWKKLVVEMKATVALAQEVWFITFVALRTVEFYTHFDVSNHKML